MLIAYLTFGKNREKAPQLMEAHKAWIAKGFAENGFVMVGSLKDGGGGAVLANDITRDAFEAYLQQDPFVIEEIVETEVREITPARTDERLAFLAA
ncbi:YciI family protein [Roseibium sp. TrichSKD4]|uniref:YciI family protein n=1 Tax=Roseibium sp. TrichSKD4 TaxID=744980 RepID=UPI00058B9755|nr:hypothetical protein [Roseibium sp. TrichSKD4]